jgi:polysaccharide chain length determinant protein (PEP-CTERM system associated)
LIPGKKYTPEDFLEIAWRRRWQVVVPFLLIAAGTFIWSELQPNRYRSQALVLVIPPQVPENYVRPPVGDTLKERLDLMRRQIMSRTQLERIITEFDLYPKERKELLMDQVTLQMQDDIRIDVPRTARREDPGSFTVSYESKNPKTAMQVTERLASLFVRANLEGRSIQADTTTQFLQSQVDETLRKLQEHEARLEVFRRSNAGRLPTEVQSNLQFMQTTAQMAQALSDGINHDRERQVEIERTIADETALGAAAALAPAPSDANGTVPQTAAQQLAAAKATLAAVRLRLKADHPDVRMLERRITELEGRVAAEALQRPVSDGPAASPLSGPELTQQRRLATLRAEHDSLDRTIALKQADLGRLQAAGNQYKARVEAAPSLEGQLSQLMRDYETLQDTYKNLLKNLQDAKVAASMEERQVSEQFRLLDPPRIPELPSSPNRLRMNLIGLMAGLGLGLALAALLEYRDTSLRTEDDVLVALSLPVVALVPTILTDAERRRSRRHRWVLGSSAVVTLIVSAVAIVWKLRVG